MLLSQYLPELLIRRREKEKTKWQWLYEQPPNQTQVSQNTTYEGTITTCENYHWKPGNTRTNTHKHSRHHPLGTIKQRSTRQPPSTKSQSCRTAAHASERMHESTCFKKKSCRESLSSPGQSKQFWNESFLLGCLVILLGCGFNFMANCFLCHHSLWHTNNLIPWAQRTGTRAVEQFRTEHEPCTMFHQSGAVLCDEDCHHVDCHLRE